MAPICLPALFILDEAHARASSSSTGASARRIASMSLVTDADIVPSSSLVTQPPADSALSNDDVAFVSALLRHALSTASFFFVAVAWHLSTVCAYLPVAFILEPPHLSASASASASPA